MADEIKANPNEDKAILRVQDLKMHFPITKGFLQKTVGYVKAVDGVSFTVGKGETLGLVGESGCGKTTAGRCLVRVYEPTEGQIHYQLADGNVVDLIQLTEEELRPIRRDIRMIFQDPYSSLNPRMRVKDIIGEPLRNYNVCHGSELDDRVMDLLKRVGLRPEYIHRYPHAFSGGERQRIGIARALALKPRMVIADEAVSALDVSVRAQIINLLDDLQQELGLTYIFIAHDLSVVEYISDRVAVMYVGKMVEVATTEELYSQPRHPYTEALLSAVPRPDPRLRGKGNRIHLEGEVPDPSNPPKGCYFSPRCQYATSQCKEEPPVLADIGDGHLVACHYADQLTLRGVYEKRTPVA